MGRRVARLAAVKPTQPSQFEARPTWAHPNSETHQAAYVRAIAWLRSGKQSRWLLDRDAMPAKWRAVPQEEATA